MSIKSRKLGFLTCSASYFSTLWRILSIADVSAPVRASIFLEFAAIYSNTAIQRLATIISTVTMAEKISPPTSYTSFIAAWLAPPPIQLPAIVVIPRQTASGPAPPIISGNTAETSSKAIGPPMTIPKVPVKNRIRALEPRPKTALTSRLKVSKTIQAGNR